MRRHFTFYISHCHFANRLCVDLSFVKPFTTTKLPTINMCTHITTSAITFENMAYTPHILHVCNQTTRLNTIAVTKCVCASNNSQCSLNKWKIPNFVQLLFGFVHSLPFSASTSLSLYLSLTISMYLFHLILQKSVSVLFCPNR